MATPTVFPVWLVAADGREELILDANGYRAAIAAGAAPFSPIITAQTVSLGSGVTRASVPVPHGPGQSTPGTTHEPHN